MEDLIYLKIIKGKVYFHVVVDIRIHASGFIRTLRGILGTANFTTKEKAFRYAEKTIASKKFEGCKKFYSIEI